ncbi:MAG: hypothetical protein R2838_08780 [Caldilineaceae bacterium]
MEQYITCRRVLRSWMSIPRRRRKRSIASFSRSGPSRTVRCCRQQDGGDVARLSYSLDRPARRTGALVRRLTDADYRLLSLVGAGGSGKTRLAVAAAARLRSPF